MLRAEQSLMVSHFIHVQLIWETNLKYFFIYVTSWVAVSRTMTRYGVSRGFRKEGRF